MPCLALTARVGLAKARSALLDVSLHFSEQNCFHAKTVCLLSFRVKSSRIRVLFSCGPGTASDTGGCKPSTPGRAGAVHPPPPGAFARGEGWCLEPRAEPADELLVGLRDGNGTVCCPLSSRGAAQTLCPWVWRSRWVPGHQSSPRGCFPGGATC